METQNLISNFVVSIFEKNYSQADNVLNKIVSEKMKQKLENLVADKKNKKKDDDCECKHKKNHKKVTKKG